MFPQTRRSVLERVTSGDALVRREAFDHLTVAYWRPSYRYLRLHWRLGPDATEDVVQAFFTTAFEKHYLDKYDPAQARFRTFLRTCLDRFVQNTRKAEQAAKRGGGATMLSLDFPGAEREIADLPAAASDAERFFHDETVRALFSRAVDAVRARLQAEDRSVMFDVFERHDLKPDAATDYAGIAAALSLTVAQVTNYLHIARRTLREAVLTELRAMSATDQEYRNDARELLGVEVES